MAGHSQPSGTRRVPGCRGLGQRIALVIGAIVVLALCGGIALLVMKVGPEVLIFLICLLLCLGVPILGGVGWFFWQRSQNDEDE